ncbi:condensation domain-containing protein [Oxalobacteraceae bacterium A2-2]
MSVVEIFETLKQNHMSIGVADGKLRVADPDQKLTPELREQIRASKDELLRILSKRDTSSVADYPQATLSEAEFAEVRQAHPDLQNLYAATALQKGMFFHETYAGRETCYTRQIYFDLRGALDIDAMAQAWQHVVGRHDIFRTAFVGFGASEIHQLVARQSDIAVTVIDRSGEDGDQQAWLEALRAEERATRFDYGRPALMRINLVRLAADRSHLLCTYHHALLDGWSIPLLLDEVNQSYQALAAGRQPALAPSVPFGRYIGWLAARDEQAVQDYWTGYLAGYTAPRLPHFPAAAGSAPGFGRAPIEVGAGLSKRLVETCARRQCTMNALLNLAWCYTLGRQLDLDDVVVGSVGSVRPPDIPQVERMLGLLVNTVPVRVRFDPSLTVGAALAALARDGAESTEYRHVALDKLQSALGFSSKLPLFETAVVFQNYPDYGRSDGDELLQDVTLANSGYAEDNNFALVLNGSLVGERLQLDIGHDERVAPGTALALAARLKQTLERLADAEAGATLLALDGEQQFPQIGAGFVPAAALPTVAELVDAAAARQPRAAAVSYDFSTLGYQQLAEKSNRLANYLIVAGVRHNDKVAILLDRSTELVTTMLATLKTGAAYVLLEAKEPDQRIAHKLRAAGVRYVLTDSQGADRFGHADARIILLDNPKVAKEIHRASSAKPVPLSSANSGGPALAYVHFASGENGYPRPVAVPHQLLSAMVEWHNGRAGPEGGTGGQRRVLCASPVLLERASLELFAALAGGAEVQLANDVLDLCINHTLAPTELALGADQLARLYARSYGFEGVRGVTLFDSRPAPADLRRLFQAADIGWVDLYLGYAGHAAVAGVHRVTRDNLEQPPAFSAIPGISSFLVLDRLGRIQPEGAPGALHVGDRARLHATGDLARLQGGRVAIVQPSPDHVDLGGYRADYREIEAHLAAADGVHACAVLQRDDGDGARLVAYVVFDDGFTGTANHYAEDEEYFAEVHRCKKHLLERLPAPLVPEVYVFLEQLPLLSSGGVDKQALRSPEEISHERRQFVAPANPVEQALLQLWEGSFLINDISCADDYFELGGSSLLQVKLGARINKDFKTTIPLTELFRDRTSIISQAEVIQAALAARA